MSLAPIEIDAQPSGHRWRMKQLDLCLNELEEANADGEEIVSAVTAARWKQSVPQLTAGIPIVQGLDIVFALQRDELAGGRAGLAFQHRSGALIRRAPVVLTALPGGEQQSAAELDHNEATKLTEQIKSSLGQASHLLLAAHEGRAWRALGHKTWESYVVRELGLSRRRSYELLDQARVARAIASVPGVGGIPHISAYAAEQLKPVLEDVLVTIRQRLESASDAEDAHAVVDDVVRSARRSVIAAQGEKTLSLAGRTGQDQQPRSTVMDDRWSADFLFALDTLCSMPAPAEIADALATHSSLRSRVDQAAGWLQTLATLLRN